MKKYVAVLLALVSFVWCVSAQAKYDTVYSPSLGMSINEFVNKYNMIQTPLGAPYKKLPINASMEYRGEYFCTVFSPADNSEIEMMIITLEENKSSADAGADAIILYCYKDADLISFIATAKRITTLFSVEIFATNYSGLYIGELVSDYYETRAQENDQYYYIQLGADSKYCAALYHYGGVYFYVLTSMDSLSKIMDG